MLMVMCYPYPYPLQTGTVLAYLGDAARHLTLRHVILLAPVRAIVTSMPRRCRFAV